MQQRLLLIHACIVMCQGMRYPSADHRDEISERKCFSSRSVASSRKVTENKNSRKCKYILLLHDEESFSHWKDRPHGKNVI